MKLACLALAALALSGCAGRAHDPALAEAAPARWRSVATEPDQDRIRKWRTAWTEALAKAQPAHGAALAAEGALLQPDAAIEWQAPPAGDYRCRTIKIGGKSEANLDFIAYPNFTCRISGDGSILRFRKLSGSQRPVGRLFPDANRRMIFLGTLELGDETRAFDYGHDRERDMAGILERVAERRWRLVLPRPAFESTLDIIELVPAGSPS